LNWQTDVLKSHNWEWSTHWILRQQWE